MYLMIYLSGLIGVNEKWQDTTLRGKDTLFWKGDDYSVSFDCSVVSKWIDMTIPK